MSILDRDVFNEYNVDYDPVGLRNISLPNSFFTPAFAPELNLEELQEIQNRQALNRAGVMAMDDAGITIPANKFALNGIANNVRFRDMLLQDLKNLPSDLRTSLGTTQDALAKDVSGLTNFLTNVKDKGIDLFGSGKDLALRGIGSIIGGPVGSFVGGAISNLKETPEQKAIKDFYAQNFGLTDTGQIASGIMQGYNPVYGFGGAGLQGAIDKRLATILKTEERKKKKGLKLSQELINRRRELEALKERDRIAKANIAATPGFDVSGGAGGNYDRSFDYGANTREAQDRRSSDLGFSDIRLKENIELIGKSPSNINIYKFNYKDNPTTYQGVMAHEVPWANVKHSNGYMMVDYNKVDVKFKKWQR